MADVTEEHFSCVRVESRDSDQGKCQADSDALKGWASLGKTDVHQSWRGSGIRLGCMKHEDSQVHNQRRIWLRIVPKQKRESEAMRVDCTSWNRHHRISSPCWQHIKPQSDFRNERPEI